MYRKFTILLALSLTTLFVKSQQLNMPLASDSNTIAFASDTQAPMWVETLWLRSNNNRAATRLVFNDILSNTRPCSLFLLGDVVNLGYSNRQWKPMDAYLQSLRSKGIEVHAILGNHEVMGQAKLGQMKFQQRFPDHVKTGYVRIKDSVAVVLLNSNFNALTPQENREQISWYEKTLQELDADPSVRFIITGCHHSPYTNSKVVGPSTAVQQKIVPIFLQSVKSKLFLSGHSHNFEHYKIQGKDFLVIGGGGGLHQPLRSGEGCMDDLCCDYKPLFHYLTVKRIDDKLQVTSMELKKDFSGFDAGLVFDINPAQNTGLAAAR